MGVLSKQIGIKQRTLEEAAQVLAQWICFLFFSVDYCSGALPSIDPIDRFSNCDCNYIVNTVL